VKIYADPSFLVSLLFPTDSGHDSAMAVFLAYPEAEWITSEWSQFETVNSLRQLCRKYATLAHEVPEGLRRYFKHLHRAGQFEFAETDLLEAVRESQQYSTAHGSTLTMRAADVLHVALLEQLTPDLFVTRDRHQHTLALARAFRSQLVS
jgi:predicted nucleic acid-binding protein